MLPDFLIPFAIVATLMAILGFYAMYRESRERQTTTLAFDLSNAQSERLRSEADRLGVKPADLARAAVVDLLTRPDEDFRIALERVLQKNAELYKRLA